MEYNWCCSNPECRRKNVINESKIREAKDKNLRVYLVCGTCGMVHNWRIPPSEKGWLISIPFTEVFARLPTGKSSDGKYLDYLGANLDRNNFLIKYGIDPELYLNWKKNGKPRYKSLCDPDDM